MILNKSWYQSKATWTLLLWPLELLFRLIACINKSKQSKGQWQAPCPLIIVGNISVGGTGKSPLTIALIEYYSAQGFKVGVVSRGYGAKREVFPYQVRANDSPSQAADEPLMIVQRTGVNLVIDPNRVRACQYLLANNECDLIISDDGLQHYKMARDIEIAVVDASRGLGNGHCLPVGPLREPASRLNSVDFVIKNGEGHFKAPHSMHLAVTGWYRVKDNQFFSLQQFNAQVLKPSAGVHAIAGIGNPARFFSSLEAMSIDAKPHVFADHYQYSADDFCFAEDDIICMTEKDAVKCKAFAPDNSYYLKVSAELDQRFIDSLSAKINTVIDQKNVLKKAL